VVLTNDAIADERVSGVFHIDNLDRALDTIQSQLHLSSVRLTDYVVLLR
jgi:ferric-dicitrate binding protein FerR (iron transport regulator)